MVYVITDELGMDMNSLGSTTFRHSGWLQGLEPDACFYIQNAASIIGLRRFDPDIPPPPPDLAVEIDITTESLNRLPTYRNLGVPEIWRYDGKKLEFLHLNESGYAEFATSRAFPFLAPTDVERFLEKSLNEGQSPALREFRQWVRTQTAA
jgi:Uma2 family endonuclease